MARYHLPIDRQAFRKAFFFRWKHSGWAIGILLPLGVGLALSHQYGFAYFCFIVGAVWASLSWLASDFLEKKRPKTRRATKKNPTTPRQPTKEDFRSFNLWRFVPFLSIYLFACVACAWTWHLKLDYDLESYEGWLSPGNESITSPCREVSQPGDLQVMVGSNAYVERRMPHDIIKVACDRLLGVNRDRKGRIGISLSLFDASGNIVTKIEDGHFIVNRNNVFTIDRKGSLSTLYVFNQRGEEALYMHLANRDVLQMRANFYYKGVHVVLDDERPAGNPVIMTDSCLGFSGAADVIFGDCPAR